MTITAREEAMNAGMTKYAHSNSTKNYRRRRRIAWYLLLSSVSTNAFVHQTTAARRQSALSTEAAASRTWDQTRHKLVYYGEDQEEEDPSPPIIMTEKRKTKPMPIVGYDAKEICETYDRRPFQVGWRMNSVGLPLLGKPIVTLT